MLPLFAFAIQVTSHAVSAATLSTTTTAQTVASPISYETLISIMLACLGVMLTALAIGIGLAAIWGYVGLKDELKSMATRQVKQAMSKKLKEYPAPAAMLDIMQRLQKKADFLDDLQNQALTSRDTTIVESASNNGVQGSTKEGATTPLNEPAQESTPIEIYPGEETNHASDGNPKKPADSI